MACQRDQRLPKGLVSMIPSCDQSRILTVLLEVLLSWGGELDGGKLVTIIHVNQVPEILCSRGSTCPRASNRLMIGPTSPR